MQVLDHAVAGLIPLAAGRCNAQILPIVGSFVGRLDDLLGLEVLVTTNVAMDEPSVTARRRDRYALLVMDSCPGANRG